MVVLKSTLCGIMEDTWQNIIGSDQDTVVLKSTWYGIMEDTWHADLALLGFLWGHIQVACVTPQETTCGTDDVNNRQLAIGGNNTLCIKMEFIDSEPPTRGLQYKGYPIVMWGERNWGSSVKDGSWNWWSQVMEVTPVAQLENRWCADCDIPGVSN